MFGEPQREALRTRLAELAKADERVAAAASLGSAARGELDRWSDIDLALRLGPGADAELMADAWTAHVAQTEQVVDQLDLHASGALFRVLLLGSGLQVDLSFWPYDQPLSAGPPLAVLFGEVPIRPAQHPGRAETLDESRAALRMGWLYALHVRSALGRGRRWQAMWMLESIRNLVIGLYCRRLGLPAAEGRGVDQLPVDLLDGLVRSYPARVAVDQLWSSFDHLIVLLLEESARHGAAATPELKRVVSELTHRES